MKKNKKLLVIITLLCYFLGFLSPLTSLIVMRDRFSVVENEYLRNLLNFQLTILLLFIVFFSIQQTPLIGEFFGGIIGIILWLTNAIFLIKATIKVSKNKLYKFPYSLQFLK